MLHYKLFGFIEKSKRIEWKQQSLLPFGIGEFYMVAEPDYSGTALKRLTRIHNNVNADEWEKHIHKFHLATLLFVYASSTVLWRLSWWNINFLFLNGVMNFLIIIHNIWWQQIFLIILIAVNPIHNRHGVV